MTLSIGRRIVGVVGAVALAAMALVVLAAPAGAVPNGVVIVNADEVCRIGTIDLGTGAVTNLQDTDCTDDLAYGPDGTLYGIVDESLVTYDPATGDTSKVGSLNQSFEDVGGLTFDSSGRLWLTLLGDETPCINVNGAATAPPDSTPPAEDLVVPIEPEWCLYQVDPATGAATFVAQLNQTGFFITNELGLAGSCDGRVLGNYNRVSPPPGLFAALRLGSFNTTTGDIVDIGPNGDHLVLSLDFEPAVSGSPQTLWGVGEDLGENLPTVYQLNQSTGAATPTNTIGGINEDELVIALAIAPISCPAAVVTIQPTFTG